MILKRNPSLSSITRMTIITFGIDPIICLSLFLGQTRGGQLEVIGLPPPEITRTRRSTPGVETLVYRTVVIDGGGEEETRRGGNKGISNLNKKR